uniref:Uncharacterized protein n=1 Tax=Spermophilus dauricus TaxID=99837 RepID=A0A8C9UT94_SPEDA
LAAATPGDPASTSAGLLLGHFVASGLVTQEMLNISKKAAPGFEKFSRLQQITNIPAEIYQKIEVLFCSLPFCILSLAGPTLLLGIYQYTWFISKIYLG